MKMPCTDGQNASAAEARNAESLTTLTIFENEAPVHYPGMTYAMLGGAEKDSVSRLKAICWTFVSFYDLMKAGQLFKTPRWEPSESPRNRRSRLDLERENREMLPFAANLGL